MPVITVTDSVYVTVGAVEADRLDKASDWPGEIYGRSLTVNVHLGAFMGRGLRCKAAFEGAEIQLLLGGALNLIKGCKDTRATPEEGGGGGSQTLSRGSSRHLSRVSASTGCALLCFVFTTIILSHLICRYSRPEARQRKC